MKARYQVVIHYDPMYARREALDCGATEGFVSCYTKKDLARQMTVFRNTPSMRRMVVEKVEWSE